MSCLIGGPVLDVCRRARRNTQFLLRSTQGGIGTALVPVRNKQSQLRVWVGAAEVILRVCVPSILSRAKRIVKVGKIKPKCFYGNFRAPHQEFTITSTEIASYDSTTEQGFLRQVVNWIQLMTASAPLIIATLLSPTNKLAAGRTRFNDPPRETVPRKTTIFHIFLDTPCPGKLAPT